MRRLPRPSWAAEFFLSIQLTKNLRCFVFMPFNHSLVRLAPTYILAFRFIPALSSFTLFNKRIVLHNQPIGSYCCTTCITRRVPDNNRLVGVQCMTAFRTQAFKCESYASSLHIPDSLRWQISVSIEPSCKVAAAYAKKFDERPSQSALSNIFGAIKVKAFPAPGEQPMRQALCTALGPHGLFETERRVGDMSKNVFIYENCIFIYINAGCHNKLLVSEVRARTQESLLLGPSWTFETSIYFNSLQFSYNSVVL